MLTIRIRQGRGGRWRWSAVREPDAEGNYQGRTVYSSMFPEQLRL